MSAPEFLLKGVLLIGGVAVILRLVAKRGALPAPTTKREARIKSGMNLQLYGIGLLFLTAFLFLLSVVQEWRWLTPIVYGTGIVGGVLFFVGRVRQLEAEMGE